METVCNALFGRYLDGFLSFLEHNIQIFNDCPAEFNLMKDNFEVILKLIEDVENANHGMKSLGHVTNQARELMYEVEDRVADYSDLNTANRLGVAKQLEDINGKLKEMKRELRDSVNAILKSGGKLKDVVKRKKPDPVNDVTKIVGVGDAITKIKNWVLNKDNVKYNRIGLVGQGGSGKTTLAQMIQKDNYIRESSQFKMMFVTVSQPVDVKTIMISMLNGLSVKIHESDDEGIMSSKIFDSLKGSRYFLILDDVWNLGDNWWQTIKNSLPEGSENCILITSRNRTIVQQMGVREDRIHVPEKLKDEDGWSLFCISAETDVSEDTEMKQIGMEIVQKCRGLPLAIKVIGGVVLYNEISPPKWMEIRDSFKEYIFNNNDDIVLGSLGLSYDDLRLTYLKPCLLCFGLFPEDHTIDYKTMISWWIGEGFVPLAKDGRLYVKLAEEYFEELVNRSLVEVVKRDYKGQVLACKVHDLVRELLIRKGKSEAFFEIGKDKISRRIIYNCDDFSIANNQISASNTKVRAIVSMFNYSYPSPRVSFKGLLDKIFKECGNIRALEMFIMKSEIVDRSTLESIRNLKHLRYLNVVEGTLQISFYRDLKDLTFPKSLLVLRLAISSIGRLPDSITELKQLILLDVGGCDGLRYFPKGLGNVSTLQVLKGFIPSDENGSRFGELRNLTQLVTLEMKILNGNIFDSIGDFAALSNLKRMRRLTISPSGIVQNLDKLVLPKHLDEVKLEFPFRVGEETPFLLNTAYLPGLMWLSLYRGRIITYHGKFCQGSNWMTTDYALDYIRKLRLNWNFLFERLPFLKTLHYTPNTLRSEIFPSLYELDDGFDGIRVFWRNQNTFMM